MNKILLAVLAAIVVIAAGVWFFFFREPASAPLGSDLPETVAVVNGEEITRDEFAVSEAQLLGGQGIDVALLDAETRSALRGQVLETLISQMLVRQAAAASGTSVDAAAVEEELTAVKGQFGTDAAFETALEAEGLTLDELREQIRISLTTEAYLDGQLGLSAIAVSDEEITAAYEDIAAGGAEDVPPLADVRDQVEAFIRGQKQQEAVALFVEGLRAEADIQVFI